LWSRKNTLPLLLGRGYQLMLFIGGKNMKRRKKKGDKCNRKRKKGEKKKRKMEVKGK
jgi:hypothetical protein